MAKGPAPKGEYAGKSSVFSTRITPDLKERLDEAKTQSGRSVSQEVEYRLRRSFVEDDKIADTFGDRQTYRVMRMIADAIHLAMADLKKRHPESSGDWLTGGLEYQFAAAAAHELIERIRPSGALPSNTETGDGLFIWKGSMKIAGLIWEQVRSASPTISTRANGSFQEHVHAVAKADFGDEILSRTTPEARIALLDAMAAALLKESVGKETPRLLALKKERREFDRRHYEKMIEAKALDAQESQNDTDREDIK